MDDLWKVALSALVAYLLGSFSTAVVVSRLVLKQDIRELGSGNAGFSNALRVMGRRWAILVFLGDILKGALALTVAALLLTGSPYFVLGRMVAALFVILGHAYPVFFGFRGGKGVATAIATIVIMDWRVALVLLAVYAVTVLASRYSSLGSIVAACSLPFVMMIFRWGDWLTIIVSTVMTLLILFWHRENIQRLRQGTENKMTFKKRTPKP